VAVEKYGVTAAIVEEEILGRYVSGSGTPITTTKLGELVTTAAAHINSLVYQAGSTPTDINNTDHPIAYRRLRDMVAKDAAVRALRVWVPAQSDLRTELQDSLNLDIVDLLRNPRGFFAEAYSRASHAPFRSHTLSIPTTLDEDPVEDNDPDFTTEFES